MNIEYRKRFLKELSLIPPDIRKKIEKFVFEELPEVESVSETGIIEQMKGYRYYYKARFG
jgi:mRNA-degrading endonuclease RelE of RelBE toxin-antitoxin system